MSNPFKGRAKSNENIVEARTDTSRIPDAEKYGKNILGRMEAALGPGKKLFSDFTPRQQEVFRLGDLGRGVGQKELGEARGMFEKGARSLGESNYQQYLQPVQKQQAEIQRRMYEQAQKQMNQIGSQYGAAGRYGSANARRDQREAWSDYLRNAALLEEELGNKAQQQALDRGQWDLENYQNSGRNFLNLGNVGRQYEDEDFRRQVYMAEKERAQADLEKMSELNNLNQSANLLNQVAPNLEHTNTTGQQRSYNLANRGHRAWNTLLTLANIANRQQANTEEEMNKGGGAQGGSGGGGGFLGGMSQGGGQGGSGGGGFLNYLSQLLSPRQYAPQQNTPASSAPWQPASREQSIMFPRR